RTISGYFEITRTRVVDVLILSDQLLDASGTTIAELLKYNRYLAIILIQSQVDLPRAVNALKQGVVHVIRERPADDVRLNLVFGDAHRRLSCGGEAHVDGAWFGRESRIWLDSFPA